MAWHERAFGNVMTGVIIGFIVWAFFGAMFNLYFRDDLDLIGLRGGRGTADAYVDIPY